ncbi:MAG: hypothetical protein AAF628_09760 [Planctomycetota bacterium]
MKIETVTSLFLALLVLSSCAFHSSAKRWNGRIGADGKPIYVHSTTNVGFNLGIVLPVFGSTTIGAMVDSMTQEIAETDGDRVRIIESAAENYWYGFPPFTWILTPVITTVTSEYQPTPAQFAKDQAEQAAEQ